MIDKTIILNTLKNKFNNLDVYIEPNLNGDKPDLLVIDRNTGVYLIEISSIKLSDYYSLDKITFINRKTGLKQLSPIKKLEYYKNRLYGSHVEGLFYAKVRNIRAYSIVKNVVIFQDETVEGVKQFFGSLNVEYTDLYGNNNFESLPRLRESNFFNFSIYQGFLKLLNVNKDKDEDGISLNYTKTQKKLSLSKIGQYKIRGIAGSGKTHVLVKRAINANMRHSGNVLILTYNKSLKQYINLKLNEVNQDFNFNSFVINNYHAFIKSVGINLSIEPLVVENMMNEDETINLDSLTYWSDSFPKYETILIDEVQDYQTKWLRILKEYFLVKDGEFVVFGDEKQNIYDRKLEDKKVNTTISGRWNELRDSFRSSGAILDLNNAFQKAFLSAKYEVIKNENLELKQTTFTFDNDEEYVEYISFDIDSNVKELAYAIHLKIKNNNLNLRDIAIIGSRIDFLQELDFILRNELKRNTQTIFETKEYLEKYGKNQIKINEIRGFKKNNFSINTETIKLSTIHSFKGYEVKTLFFIITQDNIEDEVIYTAFTRAKENLYIINNGNERYDEFFRTNVRSGKNIQEKLVEEQSKSIELKYLDAIKELQNNVKDQELVFEKQKKQILESKEEKQSLTDLKNDLEQQIDVFGKKILSYQNELADLKREGSIDKVVEYTTRVESLLWKYGGRGKGIHSQLNSIKNLFDETTIKKIRYIATIRNKVVHEYGFKINDFNEFEEICLSIISSLEGVLEENWDTESFNQPFKALL